MCGGCQMLAAEEREASSKGGEFGGRDGGGERIEVRFAPAEQEIDNVAGRAEECHGHEAQQWRGGEPEPGEGPDRYEYLSSLI